MKIKGANLGDGEVVEGEYKLLSQHPFFKDRSKQDVVKKLEQLYLWLKEESNKIDIQPFPQRAGKVEILPGMVNHQCSNSLESLRALSQYGVLASEWFGKIESAREGVFCAFVDRIHSEDNSDEGRTILARAENKKRLQKGVMKDTILLFFDSTNRVWEQLVHLDYFEYGKVKKQNPEKLPEMYSREEIELFEQIIEPFSKGFRNNLIHLLEKDMLPYCDWSAIPGGIPSALVNGICTKTKTYDKSYIDEIAKLFPNATIFNGDLEILCTPKEKKDTQELGQETLGEQEDIELLDGIEQVQANQEKTITAPRESE